MAAFAATAASSALAPSSFVSSSKPLPVSSTCRPVIGLPTLRNAGIRCSASSKDQDAVKSVVPEVAMSGALASALLAAQPAMALVDERLSTEGTGLSLGVSNPLLVWILLGVATLIWALFFVYASSLPEGDDDSGLAL